MATKRELRRLALTTYREPKPKAKRCGTCKYCWPGDETNLFWCDAANGDAVVSEAHGVCDAWEKDAAQAAEGAR